MAAVLMSLDVARAGDYATELQFGGVAEWSLASDASRLGPSVSLEQEVIPRQLQIELGFDRFHEANSTESEFEISLKKPFELGPDAELTVGLGPTWARSSGIAAQSHAVDGEFSLDFQFSLTGRWGWYIEPSYQFGGSQNSDRSAGLSMGLLLGF